MCRIPSAIQVAMLKAALLVMTLAAALPAHGEGYGTPATGEILPGWRESNGQHMAGLSIRLAPGWKTYWRAPGDSGIPPRFNWSGSTNLAGVEVLYPIPKVMDQNGIRSIGYKGSVVLPLVVVARDTTKPVELRGEIEIGACEEICIPVTLRVGAVLPARGAPNAEIAAGLASQPSRGGSMSCEIEPISDGLRLRATVSLPKMKNAVAVIETGEMGIWISEPVVTTKNGRLSAEVEMVAPTAKPFAVARRDVRMTVLAGGRAVEMLGCE